MKRYTFLRQAKRQSRAALFINSFDTANSEYYCSKLSYNYKKYSKWMLKVHFLAFILQLFEKKLLYLQRELINDLYN